MKKNIISLCTLLLLVSCGAQENPSPTQEVVSTTEDTQEQKILPISSSIIPISSIINTVGGEFVDVHTIIPAGVSPHGFDLSAKDLVALEESEVTFLIGLDQIDGFLEKPLENKKHIELAEGIALLQASAHDHDEHEGDEHEGDEHEGDEHEGDDEYSFDAHVWLGKDNIITISKKVRDELSLILPEQSEYFAKNVENFESEIEALYTDFAEKNKGKTPKEFIVFHDAYNYMMQSLNIDVNLKVPFSENVLHETGTAHMAELIEEIELHGVKHVFREPQFADGTLQKFADEYNLVVAILDPLGTDSSADGYLKNMTTNLDNISLIYE